MNLAKAYMEQFIWSNVADMSLYTRVKKDMHPINFEYLFGAPEIISQDKRFSLTIYFDNHLTSELISQFLHLEYNTICFKCKCTTVYVNDAAVTYTHIDKDNYLVVEMNAVGVEIKVVY